MEKKSLLKKRLLLTLTLTIVAGTMITAFATNAGGLRGTFHWLPLLRDEVSAYVLVDPMGPDHYAKATVTVYNKKNASKTKTETIRDKTKIIEGWSFCTNTQMSGVVRATGNISATGGYNNQQKYPMMNFYPTLKNPYV